MSLRTGHGTGAGQPRIEVLPADELPAGVPAPLAAPLAERSHERRSDGTFAPGSRTAQSAGGRASRGRTRLADRLCLAAVPDDAVFRRYRAAAASFRRVQCAELARTVGGGVCGPGPSSIVASSALALAWSRYLSDLAATTGDPELAIRAARLGETARQHLLAAHELCAREAQARAAHAPVDDPHRRLAAQLAAERKAAGR